MGIIVLSISGEIKGSLLYFLALIISIGVEYMSYNYKRNKYE